MRCFVFLCLFGAEIITSLVSSTIDEIITNAAKTTSEFAFFQHSDSERPPIKVELDMIFTADQWEEIQRLNGTESGRQKRKAIRLNTYRWTNTAIPYKIERNVFTYTEEAEIFKALNEWESYTCIRFRPASLSDRNFILFTDGDGCYSNVGMIGESQEVGLARGCRTKGVIVHEVGHAVGFHHEQTRPDRDDHVEILRENIPPNLYYNFQKYSAAVVNNFGVPYDYESVMHYGAKAFSVNGKDTIRTKDPKYQKIIGNRSGLSFNDIKLANLMYECSKKASCRTVIRCPSEGFLDKNCRCMCPGTAESPLRECQGTTPGPAIVTKTTAVTRPSPRITTTSTTGACVDKYLSCAKWAAQEECSKYFMMTYCKKSCQKCTDGGQRKLCENLGSYCDYWYSKGYCTGKYAIYMRSNCAKACGLCVANAESVTITNASKNESDQEDSTSNGTVPSCGFVFWVAMAAAILVLV